MKDACTSSKGGGGSPVFGVGFADFRVLFIEELGQTGVARAEEPATVDCGGMAGRAAIFCRGVWSDVT